VQARWRAGSAASDVPAPLASQPRTEPAGMRGTPSADRASVRKHRSSMPMLLSFAMVPPCAHPSMALERGVGADLQRALLIVQTGILANGMQTKR
jgi:hypothetical protein